MRSPTRVIAIVLTLSGVLTGCAAASDDAPPADAVGADSLGSDTTADSAGEADIVTAEDTTECVAGEPGCGEAPRAGSLRLVAGDSDGGFADGVGPLARFSGPTALCLEGDALYAADTFNATLRRVDLGTGTVTTVAGSAGQPDFTDAAGPDARFTSPRGLACLGDGTLLVADSGSLRRVSLEGGAVTTVAGFPGTPGNVDGDAAAARIGYLVHAAVALPDGERVAFTDRSNDSLRVVSRVDWSVATVAPGLSGPGGLVSLGGNRLLVADTFADRLVRVDVASGTVEPLAITGAKLSSPQGVALDASGTAWVAGFGSNLVRVDLASGVAEVAWKAFGGTFASPVWADGELVYAELERSSLRIYTPETNADRLLAGTEQPWGSSDGDLDEARFGRLTALAVRETGVGAELWLADPENAAVRRVVLDAALAAAPTGRVDRVEFKDGDTEMGAPGGVAFDASGALWATDADEGSLWTIGPGEAKASRVATGLDAPGNVAVGPNGEVFVADTGAGRVVRWTGSVFDVVGDDFVSPLALAWDADAGALWIGDVDAGTVRHWSGDGPAAFVVSGPSATEDPGVAVDGDLSVARVGAPAGLLVHEGALLICDAAANSVRRLVDWPGGAARVETLVGRPTIGGGLPPGVDMPLEDAALGFVAAGGLAHGRLWLAAEYGVYRVDLGNDGGGWTPGGPAPDAPTTPSAFTVEVGVGTPFEALPDVLRIEHGNQGLQHVTLSVRAAVAPGFHPVRLTLVGANGITTRQRVPWTDAGGGLATASGLVLVIPTPDAVLAAPKLALRAEVEGDTGLGWTEAPVTLAW